MLEELDKHQRLINVTAGVAVVIAVGRVLLSTTTEIFPLGAEIGELLYDASLAFATAWLFQWLVIVLPERARRKVTNRVVATYVNDLVQQGLDLVKTLRATTKRQGPGWPSREEIQKMCADVRTSEVPRGQLDGSWWRYFEAIYNRQERAQRALEPYYHRADEELLTLTRDEREAGLFLRQFTFHRLDPANPNLSTFADPLSKWLSTVQALQSYHERTLAPQPIRPALRTDQPVQPDDLSN